ncbi:hypothetical protein KPATCC21470_4640 [Kitasatospora purpeofusca]
MTVRPLGPSREEIARRASSRPTRPRTGLALSAEPAGGAVR